MLSLVFFLTVMPARAQTPLGLEDAIRLALAQNERALKAPLRVAAAEGQLRRARAGFLPSTLNVVLAIPMSLLGTVAAVYFLGFTLNTFTLLGLSLAVGLVVDDAVMVMENIYRHAEMGKPRAIAAADGTKEITFAALAATIAVVAIFLPVIFMEGVIGRFFFQFGVTLSVAVMLSYFEAITLAPARCSQFLSTSREGRSRIGHAVDRGFSALERAYGRVLGSGLRNPWKVLLAAVLLLAISAAGASRIRTEFVPSQDQSRLNVRLQTETGTNLSDAALLLEKAERKLSAHPEVARVLTTLSGAQSVMTLTLCPPGLPVEYANQVREHEGLSALAAMRKAGPLRLRPILMTTIATMMAAVPPVLGLGPGTETRSPMAAAVLGGLVVSTLLSLLVVPAFYVVTDRLRRQPPPPAGPSELPGGVPETTS